MGHEKHLVEGVILESKDYGESGKILQILTKDFGILSVSAIGVREIKSKMRGVLDVLEMVNFEYVEGKEINRLVGIFPIKSLYPKKHVGRDLLRLRKVISNIVNFTMRTVVGQTSNEKLWMSFLSGFEVLEDGGGREAAAPKSKNFFQILEIIWLIKILISLGYWEEDRFDEFSVENFNTLEEDETRKKVVDEINQAIHSTHL